MFSNLHGFSYLISAVLFILSLRCLSSASTSKKGILFGVCGMVIAVATTLSFVSMSVFTYILMVIVFGGLVGFFVTKNVRMTALPQLLAAFHSLVGLAAIFVAYSSFCNPSAFGIANNTNSMPISNIVEVLLGAIIGAITLSGSIVAFCKLCGIVDGKPLIIRCHNIFSIMLAIVLVVCVIVSIVTRSRDMFLIVLFLSLALGIMLISPVGGADMPVIVSMLNSYSGWAASGIGMTLENNLLIITGALVGASGAILSFVMCKGMNRSILNVVFGRFNDSVTCDKSAVDVRNCSVKLCSAEDAAFIVKNASSIIIIPGYGMAVSQSQYAIKELVDILKSVDIMVRYAIHPVAGRMPGHMNVLLAEANIPYDDVFEMDEINHDFGNTDVAIVIGANDITNPAAKSDPSSPIYGMPVLDVDRAKTVLFVKRSLGSGYAGIENQLFYRDNTMMILGDAKKVCEDMLKSIRE